MNHIGTDVHIESIDFAVVNERGCVSERKHISTNERDIITFVNSVGKPRQVIIEEGSLADWFKEILECRGERVIVTDPKRNRWIGQSEQKDVDIDAEKLAKLHLGGYTKEIKHLGGGKQKFKLLVMFYHDLIKSRTRIKNKLKAEFRQRGINCRGETVYNETTQKKWTDKVLNQPEVQWQVKSLMTQLRCLDEQITDALTLMRKQARSYGEISRIKEIPGIGFIHAATISAYVGDVRRFADKRKFWMYVGLGMAKRKSSDKILLKRLSNDYNRMLKNTFKMAAHSAVRTTDNVFRRQYYRMTLEDQKREHRAILTVARSLSATVYAMWKHERAYDDNYRQISVAA